MYLRHMTQVETNAIKFKSHTHKLRHDFDEKIKNIKSQYLGALDLNYDDEMDFYADE